MAKKLLQRPNFDLVEFYGMVTVSSKMLSLFETLRRIAQTDSAILVRGQSGTGKELVANAVHKLSRRSAGPFCAINCATLAPELMASELFGHAKGAFTGAVSNHHGLFAAANKGTLFLDEIAELSLPVQSRLLRVIQEKSFLPLGSTQVKNVDVRIISATHKALRKAVQEGSFREDLMYRIRVVPVFLPPLSARGRDIEVLLWRFIDEFNTVSRRKIDTVESSVMEAVNDYSWPGNVRELRNNVEYAFAIGEGPCLTLNDLMPEIRGETFEPDLSKDDNYLFNRKDNLSFWQRQQLSEILKALEQSSGNRKKAADLLGMSRSTLWRKLKELGLDS